MGRFEYSQVHLGGQARLILRAPDATAAEAAARAAFARIAALEDIFSDYRPGSELSRLSARASQGFVPVSGDLWTVLVRAQTISAQSEGAFDITIGPLVTLWRESRATGRLPRLSALRRAKALVGFEKLELDPKRRAARLTAPGMRLDAGGIAKGYIGDRALIELRRHGIRAALLEMGGDIVAGDALPGERGWRVRVGERVLALSRGALSTSGTSEQFVTIGGRRYAHLVDPHTGLGVTAPVQVAIRAPDGLTSDPLATACCLLPPDRRDELLRHWPGVSSFPSWRGGDVTTFAFPPFAFPRH